MPTSLFKSIAAKCKNKKKKCPSPKTIENKWGDIVKGVEKSGSNISPYAIATSKVKKMYSEEIVAGDVAVPTVPFKRSKKSRKRKKKSFKSIIEEDIEEHKNSLEYKLSQSEDKVYTRKADGITQFISITEHFKQKKNRIWWEENNYDDKKFSMFAESSLKRLRGIYNKQQFNKVSGKKDYFVRDNKGQSILFTFREEIGIGVRESKGDKVKFGVIGSLRKSLSNDVEEYTSYAITTVLNSESEDSYTDTIIFKPGTYEIILNPIDFTSEKILMKSIPFLKVKGELIVKVSENDLLNFIANLKSLGYNGANEILENHKKGFEYFLIDNDSKSIVNEYNEVPDKSLSVYEVKFNIKENLDEVNEGILYLKESNNMIPFYFIDEGYSDYRKFII